MHARTMPSHFRPLKREDSYLSSLPPLPPLLALVFNILQGGTKLRRGKKSTCHDGAQINNQRV